MTTFARSFLTRALASLGVEVRPGVSDAATTVCTDTRGDIAGSIFVALVGERFDAHSFIHGAFAAGAIGCVVERDRVPTDLAADESERLILVDDSLAALQALASAHLARLTVPVVGLTGSNGKTSTKELCAAALRAALPTGRLCATRGNLNNHIGLPLTALRATEGDEVVLLEMGMNHLGEIARLAQIARPAVGIVTNIGSAHAGNVGGIEGVAQAKGELFEALAASGGIAIVNADDERCCERAERVAKKIYFGWDESADVQLRRAAAAPGGGIECVIGVQGKSLDVTVPFEGVHNALNAAAAIALAVALNLDVEKAAAGLAKTPVSGGRLVRKTATNGAFVLDDTYNANPDSMEAGLAALTAAGQGRRLVAVLGEMLELDGPIAHHVALGESAVGEGVTLLFVCGELGRHTMAGALAAGLRDDAVVWAKDSGELAALVADAVRPNDAILIKGSRGSRMEKVVAALVASDEKAED